VPTDTNEARDWIDVGRCGFNHVPTAADLYDHLPAAREPALEVEAPT
jgi:hypothetical protein